MPTGLAGELEQRQGTLCGHSSPYHCALPTAVILPSLLTHRVAQKILH